MSAIELGLIVGRQTSPSKAASTSTGVALGATRFEGEHAEVQLGDEIPQDPRAQQRELADVVVVLTDRHHMGVADQLGEMRQVVDRQSADGVWQGHDLKCAADGQW